MIEETIFENFEEIINFVKEAYGLEITDVKKVDRGSANIYSLNNDKYILKEFQSRYTKEEIDKEIAVINHLKKHGIQVPVYIETLNKEYNCVYKERTIIIQEFIDGETLNNNEGNYEQTIECAEIYGKIVSSADRNTSVEVTLKRCYSYNKKHSQNLMENEVIEKCRRFLLEKFGEDGYARSKMYFDDKEYEKYLYDITELALNSEKFSMEIKRVNGI